MSEEGNQLVSEPAVWQFCINGACLKAYAIEEKLDAGKIQDAEYSLCEKLSINPEEARILLGRLEYQRGRIESALRVFGGIDLQAATQKIPPSVSHKQPSKKGRTRSESGQSASQHPATLLLEGIYIKAKCLQKLEKIRESAQEPDLLI